MPPGSPQPHENWYMIVPDMIGPRWRRLSTLLAPWAGLAAEGAAQGSAASDRAVLETLFDATGGPDWIDNTHWKTAAPLGEWFGVTTDTAGRVTRLELPGNGLAGPIPATLGELALLRNLDFGSRQDSAAQQPLSFKNNMLTGPIPAELGNLANLERLDLDGNALTGPIPAELGNLANLERLDLDGNALTGPIPVELGNLANLKWLDLGMNALTGPIPAELGNLASLEWLSLRDNALTGPIPAELERLASLESLNLGSNPLTGSLPQGLTRLSQLRTLDISNTGACAPAAADFQAWLETTRTSAEIRAIRVRRYHPAPGADRWTPTSPTQTAIPWARIL